MTLQALIADDEPLARRLVREFLKTHADITITAEAENGLDAAKAITELKPDLVFLDIQMPRLTGLEVLELTGRRDGVIFTTAHDQHAMRAFELHAVDYLLKPFDQTRFDTAMTRARRLLGQTQPGLDKLVAPQPLARVLVRDAEREGGLQVLAVEAIDYIEAQATTSPSAATGATTSRPSASPSWRPSSTPRASCACTAASSSTSRPCRGWRRPTATPTWPA